MFGMACVTVFVMLLLHTIEQNCIEGKEHLNIVVIFYLNANNVIMMMARIGSQSLPMFLKIQYLRNFFSVGVRIGRKKIDVIHRGKPLQGN